MPSQLLVRIALVASLWMSLLLGEAMGLHCLLDDMPVAVLQYDNQNQRYRKIKASTSSYKPHPSRRSLTVTATQGAGNRFLRSSSREEAVQSRHIQRAISESTVSQSDLNGTLYVKRCYCVPSPPSRATGSSSPSQPSTSFYCPADLNLCVVSLDDAATPAWNGSSVPPFHPQCFHTSRRHRSTAILWPLTIVLFILWFVVSFCTYSGRNAWDYAVSQLFPKWNQLVVVPVMIWRNPERAYRLVRQLRARRGGGGAAAVEAAPPAARLQVSLRTTVYRTDGPMEDASNVVAPTPPVDKLENDSDTETTLPSDASMDVSDSAICSICLIPLRDGDRIGSLSCKHNFHSACLKTWLGRRNVCPLCLCPDVADVKLVAT